MRSPVAVPFRSSDARIVRRLADIGGSILHVKHALILIGSVALAIIASKLILENVLGIDLDPLIKNWMAHAGTGSALTMIALLAADILLPIPSSLIMILSGAAFGVVWGSIFSLVGSIGGEWLGFEMVRRYGKAASERIAGEDEIARVGRMFDRYGAAAVAITRALPVIMETTSVVAGLSQMTRRTFLLASLLGTAPIVVIYAYAGAVSRETNSVLPAVIMLIAVAGFGWIVYKARMSDAQNPTT